MNESSHPKLTRFARVLSFVGIIGWFSAFAYFLYLQNGSPGAPQRAAEKTEEMSNHGHHFYVTRAQEISFYTLLWSSGSMLFIGIGLGIRLQPFKPRAKNA
jgi:hypothetical protein